MRDSVFPWLSRQLYQRYNRDLGPSINYAHVYPMCIQHNGANIQNIVFDHLNEERVEIINDGTELFIPVRTQAAFHLKNQNRIKLW